MQSTMITSVLLIHVVSGLKNFSLRALNVELEEINLLETAFAYDRREGKPFDGLSPCADLT